MLFCVDGKLCFEMWRDRGGQSEATATDGATVRARLVGRGCRLVGTGWESRRMLGLSSQPSTPHRAGGWIQMRFHTHNFTYAFCIYANILSSHAPHVLGHLHRKVATIKGIHPYASSTWGSYMHMIRAPLLTQAVSMVSVALI